jgi:hypothetical protein
VFNEDITGLVSARCPISHFDNKKNNIFCPPINHGYWLNCVFFFFFPCYLFFIIWFASFRFPPDAFNETVVAADTSAARHAHCRPSAHTACTLTAEA